MWNDLEQKLKVKSQCYVSITFLYIILVLIMYSLSLILLGSYIKSMKVFVWKGHAVTLNQFSISNLIIEEPFETQFWTIIYLSFFSNYITRLIVCMWYAVILNQVSLSKAKVIADLSIKSIFSTLLFSSWPCLLYASSIDCLVKDEQLLCI